MLIGLGMSKHIGKTHCRAYGNDEFFIAERSQKFPKDRPDIARESSQCERSEQQTEPNIQTTKNAPHSEHNNQQSRHRQEIKLHEKTQKNEPRKTRKTRNNDQSKYSWIMVILRMDSHVLSSDFFRVFRVFRG